VASTSTTIDAPIAIKVTTDTETTPNRITKVAIAY